MGHITRRRRRRMAERPVSKNAKVLMTLRGIDPKNIPGEGKITLKQVEDYLRTLEASASVDQTQKPISNESKVQSQGEAKVQTNGEEEE